MTTESKPEQSLSETLVNEDGKGEPANNVASTSGTGISATGSASAGAQYPQLIQAMQQLLENQKKGPKSAKSQSEAPEPTKEHPFWSTQPVPKLGDRVTATVNDPIETKSKDEFRKQEYPLLPEFYWDSLDISIKDQLHELYTLLHDNYVEDDDAMFRFRYSHEFLTWALKPPGWKQQWHLGLRVHGSKKLVGFISAVPSQVRVHGKSMQMTEVNFLCVHKKLRGKRMAAVLIKEITRRCNEEGIVQAAFTTGTLLPVEPVGACRYWHRSLDPQKLVDVGFSSIGKNMTMQRMKKLFKLAEEPKTRGFRQTEEKDVPAIHKLLIDYLSKFELAPEFTLEEVHHYFLFKEKIVYSYVVSDDQGNVTDFVSFYSLPSTVVNHRTHDSVNAAYSFYNVATSRSWDDLMMDALIMAKKNGFDVFNALDALDNGKFLTNLKFGIGDGVLNYFLFNWKCAAMKANEIGLILM